MENRLNQPLKGVFIVFFAIAFVHMGLVAQEGANWIVYTGGKGPGEGKHIVFLSGDEEYRSEEAMPALARILAYRHGFKCTVLFAINPDTGKIDPDFQKNIPGLEALGDADLMVMSLRFRALPQQQMSYVLNYLDSGKPIIGLRTSTHAFQYPEDSPLFKYGAESNIPGWEGGFGRQVLGETWVSHHGNHGDESTQGLINGYAEDHPVLTDVDNIWGPTDVYGINDITGEETVLVYGLSLLGMEQGAEPNYEKSILPVAWTKNYTSGSGKASRIFNTTMGAAVDLENEGLRRLLINAAYWCMGMEVPRYNPVQWVGDYNPTFFGFGDAQKGLSPADFLAKEEIIARVMAEEANKSSGSSTVGSWDYELMFSDEPEKGLIVIREGNNGLEGFIKGGISDSELSDVRYENGHLIFQFESEQEGLLSGDLIFNGNSFKGTVKEVGAHYKALIKGVKRDKN